MADRTPNYHTEQQRLRMGIANFRATIERQILEILEMEDRKAANEENILATKEAITKVERALAALEKEHGTPK